MVKANYVQFLLSVQKGHMKYTVAPNQNKHKDHNILFKLYVYILFKNTLEKKLKDV